MNNPYLLKYGLYLGYTWVIYGLSLGYPWVIVGLYMGYLKVSGD